MNDFEDRIRATLNDQADRVHTGLTADDFRPRAARPQRSRVQLWAPLAAAAAVLIVLSVFLIGGRGDDAPVAPAGPGGTGVSQTSPDSTDPQPSLEPVPDPTVLTSDGTSPPLVVPGEPPAAATAAPQVSATGPHTADAGTDPGSDVASPPAFVIPSTS